MSAVNAPQPDATVNNASEVFDSTIIPASGQVSQDQGQGPNNAEAPMHTGEGNGIDPFFFQQFMALTSFVWDTSMSVGQLLWSVPIHPNFVHQWMGHLSAMYNTYAGGFDFGITIAGTGFHAGKLLIVRLPPNVDPTTLKTPADITAFPYYVIDPKTLEVTVKSAMDQRNVMYHYLPYDRNNINSFGGFIAAYCLLPLNTSSTGATQITVQVFTRPAPNFLFSQLVPIRRSGGSVYNPIEILGAMDFRYRKTGLLITHQLKTMKVWSPQEKASLTNETINSVKLDGTFTNQGTSQHQFKQTYFVGPFPALVRLGIENFSNKKVKSYRLKCGNDSETNVLKCYMEAGTTIAGVTIESLIPDPKIPNHTIDLVCDQIQIGFINRDNVAYPPAGPLWKGALREKTSTDPTDALESVFLVDGLHSKSSYVYDASNKDPPAVLKGYVDALIQNQGMLMEVAWQAQVESVFTPETLIPPIPESIVTFDDDYQSNAMPYELATILKSVGTDYDFQNTDSLVFEVIDTKVNLPIFPLRLHFEGYFTTIQMKNNVEYNLTDERYKLVFLGVIPATTPLTKLSKIQTASTYAHNMTVSKMASAYF